MRRDDVFDRRTVLGFLHAQGADQNAFVRDGGSDALELRKLPARARNQSRDHRRLEPPGIEVMERQKGRL